MFKMRRQAPLEDTELPLHLAAVKTIEVLALQFCKLFAHLLSKHGKKIFSAGKRKSALQSRGNAQKHYRQLYTQHAQ